MHHFQLPRHPRRLPWVSNYKAKARSWYTPLFVPYASRVFFFFQRLRLLRGTALIVTRVNLHVDFTLCVWICRSWHLIILNIVKGNAMFITRLNPMRPEAVGEKQNRPFILSNIWMEIIHTAQTVTTIALGRVFAMQLMYLRGIANSKEPKQTG